MDLHTSGGQPSPAERRVIDGIVAAHWPDESSSQSGNHVGYAGLNLRRDRRDMLLPALHALQESAGGITRGGLDYLCTKLMVPPAEAYGVATAYALFTVGHGPELMLHVCDDIACRVDANGDPCAQIEELLGPEYVALGHASPPSAARPQRGRATFSEKDSGSLATEDNIDESGGAVGWVRSPCLGQCELGSCAALLQVSGDHPFRSTVAPFDSSDASRVIANPDQPSARTSRTPLIPQLATERDSLHLLRRIGLVDPESLDSYRSHGGYSALRHAIELGPERIVAELKAAKLIGRGGAAFPTGTKWQAVASNPVQPHYFVCNADESEPGTFKDRILIENDPFALIEALTIAGYATGSQHGYIYIRGEYPLAEQRLISAAAQAQARGLLGNNLMGAGFDFFIEVRRGAGAYIAGEETALFNSIEGKRPEPRNKPPFPTQVGLFGKPTGVNNVETLFNVLEIMDRGGAQFAATGTPDSTGSRLFCLSGAVERPGLYEHPFGVTLRHVIEAAGGVRGGRALQTVLLGGAAGSFVGPDQLDMPLSQESLRGTGASLGSGVVMLFDDASDMRPIVARIARFFRDESCGQCVPCRVGTARQEELIVRMNNGDRNREADMTLLADLGIVMRDASICGLGQTASTAIESAVKLGLFPIQAVTQ